MPNTSPRPSLVLLPALLLLAGLLALAWWVPNRHAAGMVPPGGMSGADRLNSLSFAPFRPGQSPLTNRFPSAAEVEADLAVLAPVTRAIRTYAALEGNYDVPALAAKKGLKVWLGIWLGADRAQNAKEIARGIELANAHPDTVERVIVGNEVLLRRDLPVGELIAAIDTVKRQVRQPVTYADVWEFWEQFPDVAAHVDIVTIHLLPYWEDDPTSVAGAMAHIEAIYHRMATRFAGQKIVIGETGWPSAGRPRRDAVPARVAQARFIREFVALAQRAGFDYNLIEAFDQVWKYKSEGTVGAAWGLFEADRTEKYPAGARVEEDPNWAAHAAISVLLGGALLVIGLAGRALKPGAQARLAGVAMAAGGALVFAFAGTWPLVFDGHLLLAFAVNLPAQAALAILLVRRAGAVLAGPVLADGVLADEVLAGAAAPTSRTGAQASEAVRSLLRLRPAVPRDTAGWLDDLSFLFLWTAAVLQLLLLFDPRYRDFPLPVFAVPLLAVLARAALRDLPRHGGGREELFAGGTLALAALASAVMEGRLNAASLVWNAVALVLAAPALVRLAAPALLRLAAPALLRLRPCGRGKT